MGTMSDMRVRGEGTNASTVLTMSGLCVKKAESYFDRDGGGEVRLRIRRDSWKLKCQINFSSARISAR